MDSLILERGDENYNGVVDDGKLLVRMKEKLVGELNQHDMGRLGLTIFAIFLSS